MQNVVWLTRLGGSYVCVCMCVYQHSFHRSQIGQPAPENTYERECISFVSWPSNFFYDDKERFFCCLYLVLERRFSFDQETYTVMEGGTVEVCVSLSGPPPVEIGRITVGVESQSGTATGE